MWSNNIGDAKIEGELKYIEVFKKLNDHENTDPSNISKLRQVKELENTTFCKIKGVGWMLESVGINCQLIVILVVQ